MVESFKRLFTTFTLWLFPEWVHPNDLTKTRIVGTPIVVGSYYLISLLIDLHVLWAVVPLSLLAATDLFDGILARARGLVSAEGKEFDALADYVFVCLAAVPVIIEGGVLLQLSFEFSALPAWCLVIVLVRAVSIMVMRTMFKEKSRDVDSLPAGKLMSASLAAALIILLASTAWPYFREAGEYTLYVAAVFALISWGQYLYYFRKA